MEIWICLWLFTVAAFVVTQVTFGICSYLDPVRWPKAVAGSPLIAGLALLVVGALPNLISDPVSRGYAGLAMMTIGVFLSWLLLLVCTLGAMIWRVQASRRFEL
jgi:hypothetical protein